MLQRIKFADSIVDKARPLEISLADLVEVLDDLK